MRLSRQVDCLASRPGIADKIAAAKAAQYPAWNPLTEQLDKSLVVTVWLRNRSGLDQRLPATLLRQDPRTSPALYAGMKIHFQRARNENAARGNERIDANDKDWPKLEPKPHHQFKATADTKVLGPAEDFIACQLDLHDWFDITESGSYRLRFTFDTSAGGFADGYSNWVTFSLKIE